MGRRSRKRRAGSGAVEMQRGYARSRGRTDAVRARLEPLGPGERPLAVTIAALLAALIVVANLVLLLAGWEPEGKPKTNETLVFCGIMLLAAGGMWARRYWAVLGFEMLLGIAIVGAALSLLRASNLAGVALSVGVLAVCGPLFWFLIRAMARLQMPSRTR